MKTRLFVGNLPDSVTDKDLREKFEALLSGHKDEADVGNVEVRCKNETNFFGYVDIQLKNEINPEDGKVPGFLRKYIDLMNNTKWKGSLIKVQPAKESFIDKLRREQQSRGTGYNNDRRPFTNQGRSHDNSHDKEENSTEQSRNQRQATDILNKMNRSRERGPRKNKEPVTERVAKFDFEIVGGGGDGDTPKTTSPAKTKQVKKSKTKGRKNYSSSSDDDSDDDVRDGIPKFKGLLLSYPEGLPEPAPPPSTQNPEPEMEKKRKKKNKTTENESETLAKTLPVTEEPETETPIQKKLLNIAFELEDADIPIDKQTITSSSRQAESSKHKQTPMVAAAPSQISSGVNFKKSKQQKSDQLRLQSLDKLKDLKAQRNNLIKSSLSSVTAAAPATQQRKVFEEDEKEVTGPESKRSKMTIFDDDDEDDEENEGNNLNGDENLFNVKKQFEGAQGQKLLELQTRWGNDDRFKIDDRFKDSEDEDGEEGDEPVEKEKEKQLNILTDLFGKDFRSAPKEPGKKSKKDVNSDPTTKSSFASVIMPRYDPEAEVENVEIQSPDKNKRKKKEEKAEKKKTEDKEPSGPEEPKPIRSTEPATYKTVSNLKEMFSGGNDSTENPKQQNSLLKLNSSSDKPSFSLLATFGGGPDGEDDEEKLQTKSASGSSTSGGPRSFWQSNPFRYDSSDDEDDTKTKSSNKSTGSADKSSKSKPPTSTPASSDLIIHGKVPFFFVRNDKRFEGLEDYFLKLEDYEGKGVIGGGEVQEGNTNDKVQDKQTEIQVVEDFSLKRQELKAIIKAKIRNTKRKDEKRTLAIKRAMRKRKRRIHQNNRSKF